jgi:hypothetical protein
MTTLTELPRYAAPRVDDHREWAGYLTIENVEHVAQALRSFLVGNTYVWAEAYEYNDWRLRVRTGMTLGENTQHPSGISAHINDYRAAVNVCDSYGVWGLHSGMVDQRLEGHPGERRYASRIEIGRSADLGTWAWHITHLTPEGKGCRWTVALESAKGEAA